MPFDINAARQAGYTDEDIKKELILGGNFDVEGALVAGYTLDDIANEVSRGKPQPQPVSGEITEAIPSLAPEMVVPTPSTPEEREISRQKLSQFIWPGKEQAGKELIKGTTTALGLGGAALGSFVAPAAGTALGYAAGERLGKGIEVATGVSEPETPSEAALATAQDIAIGYLPWGISKVAGVPSAVKGAIRGGLTKETKIAKFIEKLGGKIRPSVAGEIAQAGAKEKYTAISKIGDKLYEDAKKLLPEDTQVFVDGVRKEIDIILQDVSYTEAEKNFARSILKKISPEVKGGIRGRVPLPEDVQRKIMEDVGEVVTPMNLEGAFTLRRELSNATKGGGTQGHIAGRILDSLNTEIDSLAGKMGAKEGVEQFRTAINYWREMVIPQRQEFLKLGKISAEKIPNILTTNIKDVQALKSAIPEEDFQNIKQGFITQIFESGEGNPHAIAKSLRVLTSKKKELMETAFSPEEVQLIKLIGDPTKSQRFLEEHPGTKWLYDKLKSAGIYAAISMGIYGVGRKMGAF